MKMFFIVGFATLAIAVASIGQETAAQYAPAGQPTETFAQLEPATNGGPQVAAVDEKEAAAIKANLAMLSDEDRELAEAQGFCPIMLKNRLGVMGPPIKVMVKDQPVFVCCKGCTRKVLADPQRTLATVENLRIQEALAKLNGEDRQVAQAQGYCPVMTDSRLGSMGTPIKVMVNNQPVFLCCKGCQRKALANPDQTLAVVAGLKAKVAEAAARKAMVEQGKNR